MIKLELDEQQAWFLTQLLENVFNEEEDDQQQHLFFTPDENEELTFDEEFKSSISSIYENLIKVRGF